MSEKAVGSILVVDDESMIRELLYAVLTEQGHQVSVASNGEEAIGKLKAQPFEVVLADLRMQPLDGIDVLRAAKRLDPTTEVIIVTGHGTVNSIVEAIREGAYDYLVKPFGLDRVTIAVEHALHKRRLTIERDRLAYNLRKANATHRELFELAIRDGLTNLYNYRYFMQELERSLSHYPVSLVMFDTDKFKNYNDRYGHLEGDKVLQKIADIIRSTIRQSDIGARYGGDEFAIILPKAQKEQALTFAKRCVRLVQEHYATESEDVRITLSGGVASCPEDARESQALVQCADEACYRAKQAGGNQAVAY